MPVQILLLGTVHFANPGHDQFNVRVDDVLAPQRQLEIREVVDRLIVFAPTKVAVEALPSGKRVARYVEFVAGNHELDRSEVEQIGFRVAHRMGHQRIFGIDVQGEFYVPEIEQLVSHRGPHAARWASIEKTGRDAVADIGQWLRTATIGQVLARLNSRAELERVAAPYSKLIEIVTDQNDAGSRMAANWQARNALIVERLLSVLEPDDRALVIFGQGHIPAMTQILGGMNEVSLVDPLVYLPRN